MKRNSRKNDHAIATAVRYTAMGVGVLAGLMIIRSIPDFIRYMKIERM
jgi:hypothetical protein